MTSQRANFQNRVLHHTPERREKAEAVRDGFLSLCRESVTGYSHRLLPMALKVTPLKMRIY